MIDWFILIFYTLDSLGILILENIILNLILLILIRGLYLFIQYNYRKSLKDGVTGVKVSNLYSRREEVIFGLKQVVIVLLPSFFTPVTTSVIFYSILMIGGNLRRIDQEEHVSQYRVIGTGITILAPLIGFYLYGGDPLSLIGIGISLILYHQYGFSQVDSPFIQGIEKGKGWVNRLPRTVIMIGLVLLIILPTLILAGVALYTPPRKITVRVEMRDGITLATDIYLAPGSLGMQRPVILIRTPYDKNNLGPYGFLYLTQGYHMVVQDIRGTYDSEDHETFLMFQKAYQDGVDTIAWVLNQTWSNGKIASVGASALCNNQYYYAGMNPEGLVAQSLMIGTPDLYKTSIWQGGAFREYLAKGWLESSSDNAEFQLQQLITHPKKDSYYNTTSLFMDLGPSFSQVNVSAIHIGGWYDLFQQGTLDGYMGYDDLGLPGARGKQLLIMGPFTHGMPGEGQHGEVVFPTKSKSGWDLYLEWEQALLDHVLLGKYFDWSGNRVAYYMMGDPQDSSPNLNDYRYAADWPIPYSNESWYLQDDGLLLLGSPAAVNHNYSYVYDPRDPIPTIGGTNLLMNAGPYDQQSIESRGDVLLFETQTLTEEIEVVGRMWARLWVMSNATATDFTVKITDVYPNGSSMLISDGIINTLRRDGMDKDAAPLQEGDPVEVWIDLWSTAYQFDLGHKIRIAISSSNYPRFAINPNTGEPTKLFDYQYSSRVIANNTIVVGPNFPSQIILPIPI
ncbi:MAG: CocE/NonD family hydrolase [Candidatus Thorarchaeota archaeon]